MIIDNYYKTTNWYTPRGVVNTVNVTYIHN